MIKFFVEDPDPGSDAFKTKETGSGMEKYGSGSYSIRRVNN
jgi:hypothetical protein